MFYFHIFCRTSFFPHFSPLSNFQRQNTKYRKKSENLDRYVLCLMEAIESIVQRRSSGVIRTKRTMENCSISSRPFAAMTVDCFVVCCCSISIWLVVQVHWSNRQAHKKNTLTLCVKVKSKVKNKKLINFIWNVFVLCVYASMGSVHFSFLSNFMS